MSRNNVVDSSVFVVVVSRNNFVDSSVFVVVMCLEIILWILVFLWL